MDDLTPEQLSERAEELRDAARRARELAGSLGSYLDSAVTKATGGDPAIWTGPFADQANTHLSNQQSTLQTMAQSLQDDATRWDNEADTMETEAANKEAEEEDEDEEGGN